MGVRVNAGLSLKDRKVYTFDNFRGVDFSTSPYKVSKQRAISAQNLIYDNGTNRKRNGWVGLCKLPGAIDGLFSFEIEHEKIILAYAGKRFYLLNYNADKTRFVYRDITNTCTYSTATIDENRLIAQRIQLYVNKNKAYIVGCGDYLVLGKWGDDFELRRVFDNEDTFIPTTTINIDEDGVVDTNRGTLDDVNILSSYRKNRLLGVDKDSATWTLDTAYGADFAVNENSDVFVEVDTYDAEGKQIHYSMNNRLEDDKTCLYQTGDDLNVLGYINFQTGKLTLDFNTKPLENDSSNITITFKCSTPGQEDILANGTISTLFGGGGSSNRLFISGNSNAKHKHVWSEMYDFTYFTDTNYDEIGNDGSAIVGYVRATDGILMVFKEKTGNDATIYYVSGNDTQDTDIDGDYIFKTKFTKVAGNISDTIYGKYATASLNGDNLILTQNGVKGLELYENLTTSAYRVRQRSRNVDNKLLKHSNLKDACAIVYNDKYYLSVEGVVYVCDSRFTFQVDEDISDSFNYEWYYFTNIDAHVWCEIDTELFFGTSAGLICKFEENNYADTTFQDTEAGDIYISYNENKVAYNMELDSVLNESTNIKFTSGDVYAVYFESNEIPEVDESGCLHITEEMLGRVYEGIECYADRADDTGLEPNVKYFVGDVNLDNLTFKLFKESGEQAVPTTTDFRLCKRISNKTLYIDNIDETNKEFQLKEFVGGNVLQLVTYNYTMPTALKATISFMENVVATWYTPICDFGTTMYSKTLLGVSITTEPLIKAKISVGYQTRNIEKDFLTRGTRGFSFDDIDFSDFSFESSFTNSNTIRVKERNFNFIVVRYISDNQKACAVNGITIQYKINRLNKGVR